MNAAMETLHRKQLEFTEQQRNKALSDAAQMAASVELGKLAVQTLQEQIAGLQKRIAEMEQAHARAADTDPPLAARPAESLAAH